MTHSLSIFRLGADKIGLRDSYLGARDIDLDLVRLLVELHQ